MDGTLTEPMLDFAAIKSEMAIGDGSILEAMATMDEIRRAECELILDRHEKQAADHSTLNDGCRELFEFLRSHRLPTAVITRNSRTSLTTVMQRHGLRFDLLLSREDSEPKPSPQALLLSCQRLNVSPADVWMIGDGRYDIEAGNAAGIATIWLSGGRQRHFDAMPTKTISDLHELRLLLRKCMNDQEDR
jgi:HAD superfamily hydrolase (TIGR01549 family)